MNAIEPQLHLFDYDDSAPVRLETVAREERDGVVLEEVRYDAGSGARASAYVVTPDGATPSRGVVIAHGGTAPGKHIFLGEGLELARRGTTVVIADTSLPSTRDPEVIERALVAAILVQRRGLDVLAQRGATSFGYFGHSFGGLQGGVLAAVEPRLAAIVVASAGTHLVERLRQERLFDEEYLAASERFDPAHYVRRPGARSLLFQHGTKDSVISVQDGRDLYAAAAEPKRWVEYDWDHGLDACPEARADRFAFFDEELVR